MYYYKKVEEIGTFYFASPKEPKNKDGLIEITQEEYEEANKEE